MNIEFKENYSIKNFTSFKIGGEVKRIFFPKNKEEFTYLLKTLDNPIIFGQWSNVLISSSGIKNDVISTAKMDGYEIDETKVIAMCGVKGPRLAQITSEQGLSGFEFMIGFPGSIGGNIYMNASAHTQAISDRLVAAEVFDVEKKETLVLKKEDLEFGYRTSILQRKNYILISAEFELEKSPKDRIKKLLARNLEFRKSYQPSLSNPNAGSIFKNPENDSAGRLLDKAGAKDFKVKGAQVWEKHANFIVNKDCATSFDVLSLMKKMKDLVEEKYTISLKPEIKYFGEMTPQEREIWEELWNLL